MCIGKKKTLGQSIDLVTGVCMIHGYQDVWRYNTFPSGKRIAYLIEQSSTQCWLPHFSATPKSPLPLGTVPASGT